MSFGKVIVSFRKKWSIEQVDLAKEIGISKAYLSLIEKDKRAPLHIIKKIADFFEVPFSYFILEAHKTELKGKSKKMREAIETTEPLIRAFIERLTSKEDTTRGKGLHPPDKKKRPKRKGIVP